MTSAPGLADPGPPEEGRLATNVTHFARALRRAGLRIGPRQVVEAVRALEVTGFSTREDFYWTLHAVLVRNPEERQVFFQVFRLFWRDPQFLDHMMSMLLPSIRGVQEPRRADPGEKRAAEALLDGVVVPPPPPPGPKEAPPLIEADAQLTASAEERLRQLDFELMSADEMQQARRMLERLSLPVQPILSRRTVPAIHGERADWRASLRESLRRGGEIRSLSFRARRKRWPDLVVLCDISGSMTRYSRMVLHFLHAIMNRKDRSWGRVHAFTFGTRLTPISRHLAQRDVDAALRAAGQEAQDWQGGTHIGGCLHAFNRDWARRVLGRGAVVLLITDGLDRDGAHDLGAEMQRLHLSARRVVWINPLLRWDGFAPLARGIAAMLPYVDSFRAAHNIASLQDLAESLGKAQDSGVKARMMAALRRGGSDG